MSTAALRTPPQERRWEPPSAVHPADLRKEMPTGRHTCRATGITAFLEGGGNIETAQRLAGHADPRTTKLYDRRQAQLTQDEIERIGI